MIREGEANALVGVAAGWMGLPSQGWEEEEEEEEAEALVWPAMAAVEMKKPAEEAVFGVAKAVKS